MLKIQVSRDVTPCWQLPTFRRIVVPPSSGIISARTLLGLIGPKHESITILRNVRNYLPIYTAWNPERFLSLRYNEVDLILWNLTCDKDGWRRPVSGTAEPWQWVESRRSSAEGELSRLLPHPGPNQFSNRWRYLQVRFTRPVLWRGPKLESLRPGPRPLSGSQRLASSKTPPLLSARLRPPKPSRPTGLPSRKCLSSSITSRKLKVEC